MTLTSGSQVFGALFRHLRAAGLSRCRCKSSYSAVREVPHFEEEKEKEENEEVRAKYLFRPRLPAVIENDHFNVPFQREYDQICRDDYAWDWELNTVKTVWERLKPPPPEKVEDNVLVIGNPRSIPLAPNEWCIERAFDCHRNRRDAARIHLTMKFLGSLKRLPDLRIGMIGMAHQFQQKVLMERTRKLFELACQTYYTGDLKKLIESDENAEPIVEHMQQVEQYDAKRQLLNITEQDIITVVPGTYGAIQDLFRVYFASTYSLSITCCALYHKSVLYTVADQKYESAKKWQVAMPYRYSYCVPHLVFGNFGYWYSRKSKRFELHDLHILGFSVLPWYKDLPGTDGKFFSPKYERIPLSGNAFFSFR